MTTQLPPSWYATLALTLARLFSCRVQHRRFAGKRLPSEGHWVESVKKSGVKPLGLETADTNRGRRPQSRSLRPLFDFRAHFCHSAPMEAPAFGFRLRATAPKSQKRFPISRALRVAGAVCVTTTSRNPSGGFPTITRRITYRPVCESTADVQFRTGPSPE